MWQMTCQLGVYRPPSCRACVCVGMSAGYVTCVRNTVISRALEHYSAAAHEVLPGGGGYTIYPGGYSIPGSRAGGRYAGC